MNELAHQWRQLHQDHEVYERQAFWLKLLLLAGWTLTVSSLPPLLWSLSIGLAWLLEAIWRTGQARLGRHLLKLEQALNQNGPEPWLYQDFEQARGGARQLISEYLCQGLKPSVLWLYPILLGATWLF